jgi:hypothetical protein
VSQFFLSLYLSTFREQFMKKNMIFFGFFAELYIIFLKFYINIDNFFMAIDWLITIPSFIKFPWTKLEMLDIEKFLNTNFSDLYTFFVTI